MTRNWWNLLVILLSLNPQAFGDSVWSNASVGLGSGVFILSLSRQYQVGLGLDGKLAVKSQAGEVVWTSDNEAIRSDCVVNIEGDGNLVIRLLSSGSEVWSTKTGGRADGPFKMVMQDDGELALFAAESTKYWSSAEAEGGHRFVQIPLGEQPAVDKLDEDDRSERRALIQAEAFGGTGGTPFDDGQHPAVAALNLRCGDSAYQIRTVYSDNTAVEFQHGGPWGNDLLIPFDFNHPVTISIHTAPSDKVSLLVRGIKISQGGDVKVCGEMGPIAGSTEYNLRDIFIRGFYGREGSGIDQLGIYYDRTDVPVSPPPTSPPPPAVADAPPPAGQPLSPPTPIQPGGTPWLERLQSMTAKACEAYANKHGLRCLAAGSDAVKGSNAKAKCEQTFYFAVRIPPTPEPQKDAVTLATLNALMDARTAPGPLVFEVSIEGNFTNYFRWAEKSSASMYAGLRPKLPKVFEKWLRFAVSAEASTVRDTVKEVTQVQSYKFKFQTTVPSGSTAGAEVTAYVSDQETPISYDVHVVGSTLFHLGDAAGRKGMASSICPEKKMLCIPVGKALQYLLNSSDSRGTEVKSETESETNGFFVSADDQIKTSDALTIKHRFAVFVFATVYDPDKGIRDRIPFTIASGSSLDVIEDDRPAPSNSTSERCVDASNSTRALDKAVAPLVLYLFCILALPLLL